jgi:hypothetical protein
MKLALAWTASKLRFISLKTKYEDIIKLEWLAVASLFSWLLLVFATILQ